MKAAFGIAVIGLGLLAGPAGAGDVPAYPPCVAPAPKDLICRHYGYKRHSRNYAICRDILYVFGTSGAVSNAFTINYDPLRKLPPRACR